MGQDVSGEKTGPEAARAFTKALLRDLQALERMLQSGMIERGIRRIGAEQEMFLVDDGWRPTPAATKLLEKIDDPHFTHELGLFNLELNLDPHVFSGDCLSRMEAQLNEHLDKALRRLRKICNNEGITRELKRASVYEKPSERRRRKERERLKIIRLANRRR